MGELRKRSSHLQGTLQSEAPTGRKRIAQGNALGNTVEKVSQPCKGDTIAGRSANTPRRERLLALLGVKSVRASFLSTQ